MSDKVTDFPQYRKLSNNKSFYCIVDDRHWKELQVIGEKVLRFQFEATQYPEILRIMDMLSFKDGFYLASDREEFEEMERRVALR
jgi:hypothetical protein